MYNQQFMWQQQMGYPMGNPYSTMGTQYVARPTARNTQPLSNEVIGKLRSTTNFNWTLTQEDLWRAQCTHKDRNTGASTIVQDNDGNCHCDICSADFRLFDGSMEDVERSVKAVKDILQTIKTIFLDIPENLAAAYFQYIPLLDKIPHLWVEATKNFSRYDGMPVATNVNGYTTNNFGILGQMTGQNMFGMYAPQAPVYGGQQFAQPMGQPQFAGMPTQPMQAPMYQQGQQFAQPMQGGNPFVAPMPGTIPAPAYGQQMVQPQVPVYGGQQVGQLPVVPQTNVAPQTPVAETPANNGEVVQQQSFKV